MRIDRVRLVTELCNTTCLRPWVPAAAAAALRRLRQEDGEFKANLGYSMKLCLKSHAHP